MTQSNTKTRLLNAAESLFSLQGFANTSLRAITAKADANLAAANYHFGSKEALLGAVLDRRLVPLNQVRSERIDQVLREAKSADKRPVAKDLLRAFIEPTMTFHCKESGSRDFVSIIGRSLTADDPVVRELFLERINPLINQMHQALCLALPQLPPKLIFTRLFFTIGAMSHCLCFAGIAPNSKTSPALNLEDVTAMTKNLINFVAPGLEAPC